MLKEGSGKSAFSDEYVRRFSAAYNDRESYPALNDVARALGISYQTVRNRASDIRRQAKSLKQPDPLVSRATLPAPKKVKEKVDPAVLAAKRAGGIRHTVHQLFQNTRYPVLNPEALMIEERTTRRWNSSLGDYVETDTTPRTWLADTLRVAGYSDVRGRGFILTGAQNDADLHEQFWENLEVFAAAEDAEIVVGPWTYETNWWDENNPAARDYDDRLIPHLCFGQMPLGPDFVFCGEMNTLPTSPRPVQDLTSYTQGRWGVFPHARLQLLSVPSTNPGEQAYHVMTTGAVTRPKVIPRKAGIKAIFHHVFGAAYVRFDEEGLPFVRQINATDDGSFYDLDAFVCDGRITRGHRARAITFADLHTAKLGTLNQAASFGFDFRTGNKFEGSLLEVLDPEHVFLEDIHDNEKGSHHREHDVNHHFEMAVRGRDSVEQEVGWAVDFLKLIDHPGRQIHVVESNHDVHLERYIREGRYREDGGHNLLYGLKLDVAYNTWRQEVARCLDAEVKPPKFSLLEWAIRDQAGPALNRVHWIYDGSDSFVLDGVEVGHHGHRGKNGAHGSPAGFATLGRKMTIGDKHSPCILDGVVVAGAMELQHGYNKGPSGWSVTHAIQYRNGKRTLATLQKGKWRAA